MKKTREDWKSRNEEMEEAVFEPRERGGRDGEGIDEIWG